MELGVANSSAQRGQAYPEVWIIFRYVILCIFILQSPSAWAQNTLVATIWGQYRVPPILPFAAFEQDLNAVPLPGSTIRGISTRTLDGVSTYDLSDATICSSPNFNYPKFRGTQGFRRSFPAENPLNKTELRLLFAFDDDALPLIQSYEVTVSARFLTIPYDQVLSVSTQTKSAGRCSGSNAPALKTVVKPIVADIQIIFQLTRPLSEETMRRLNGKLTVDQPKTEGARYQLSMHQKLIALGLSD